MKEIYFCIDVKAYLKHCAKGIEYHSYAGTKFAIDEGYDQIVTTSIANLSFDLIDMGYTIYLCYEDKKVKIEPHMEGLDKDLKKGHNLLKLFLGGTFNELLGINNL